MIVVVSVSLSKDALSMMFEIMVEEGFRWSPAPVVSLIPLLLKVVLVLFFFTMSLLS